MNTGRLHAIAWGLAGLAVVSVVLSFVVPAIVPSIAPNPLVVFGVLVVVAGFGLVNARGGSSGGAEGSVPRRPGNVDASAAQALLLQRRRDERDSLYTLYQQGLITEDDLDQNLKHLLNSPIQGPPQRRG